MSAQEILVVVDGETLPLEKCAWVQLAPCGCKAGIFTAYRPANGRFPSTGPYATVEQVEEAFNDNAEQIQRDRDLGFTYELQEWSKAHEGALDPCTHDPKWGVPPRPAMPGFTWATPHASVAKAHLVTSGAVDEDRRTSPVCSPGQRPKWWASASSHDVECKRCLRIAEKQVAA